jgi:predicted CopG family antitoxin
MTDDKRTTVTVHNATKSKLQDLKRGGESFDQLLDRLAREADERISRREYEQEIESMAERIIRESGEYDREMSEIVHEDVDSHQWVIYSSHHADVLAHADEPDDWKHLVADGADWRESMQAMAFAALRSDVWAEIHRQQEGD